MDFRKTPFMELLKDRNIFSIFDRAFRQGTWLDVTALLGSESCIDDAYRDETIPTDTLDLIVLELEKLYQE